MGGGSMPQMAAGDSIVGRNQGAERLENNATSIGRFPANFIHDGSDEVVGLFPDTKGGSVKPFVRDKSGLNVDLKAGIDNNLNAFDYADSGSAARFFYCAKASKRDRNEGLDGFEEKTTLIYSEKAQGPLPQQTPSVPSPRANHHPTVKPTTLMQYLVRLVTPPNGIVLDPFMGSGSTGKACAYEGFDFIGIDQSAEYVAIAQARIDFALANKSDELEL
jgi:site-specific DNA-methyltransferase (adenine-specific)